MVVHDRTGRGGGIWEAPCVLHTRVTVITDHSSPGHTDLPGNLLQSQDSESLTLSGVTVTSDHERLGGDAGVLHNTALLWRGRGWANTEQRVTSEYQQQEETVIQIILYPAAVIRQKMEGEIQSRSGSSHLT